MRFPPVSSRCPSGPTRSASLAILAFLAPFIQGADWPWFLGPGHTGISKETGLLKEWPPGGPPLLWKRKVGASFAAPSVAGSELFLLDRVGNRAILYSLDAETGKERWRFSYPTDYVDVYGYNGGPRCAPAIVEDKVYIFGVKGELRCLGRREGKLLWDRSLNLEYGVPRNFFGVGSTPLVEGDRLLLNLGGPLGAGCVALNRHTGETVWSVTDDGASYSSPICSTMLGKRLAFFFTKRGLVVAEVKTGKIHSTYYFRSRLRDSVNASNPVVIGNDVFLSASYRTGAVLLHVTETGLEEVWKSQIMQSHWATSIYRDEYLYGFSGRHESDCTLRCIKFKAGKLMWEQGGMGRASFILADGRFIILSERGELLLAELSPSGFKQISSAGRVLAYPCFTAPILANGHLYIRDERHLLCYDLREKH